MLPVGIAIAPEYDAGETLAPSVPDTVMLPPDVLIVVVPEYVFEPDNVSVPVPDFVNVPEPVVIAAIDDVPTLSTVNPMSVPVTPPDNVNDEPVSICTSDAANIVTAPEIVFVPLVLRIAPVVEIPVPEIVNASPTNKPTPLICTAAPEATVVAPAVVPRAELLLTTITPASTEVAPVNVLTADNVNVPVPDFVNVPVDVCIGSETKTSPVFASNVRLNVPVIALPDDGSNVNVPVSA